MVLGSTAGQGAGGGRALRLPAANTCRKPGFELQAWWKLELSARGPCKDFMVIGKGLLFPKGEGESRYPRSFL